MNKNVILILLFILSLFSILSLTGAIKEKDSFTRSEIISGSPWTKSALTLGGKYQDLLQMLPLMSFSSNSSHQNLTRILRESYKILLDSCKIIQVHSKILQRFIQESYKIFENSYKNLCTRILQDLLRFL